MDHTPPAAFDTKSAAAYAGLSYFELDRLINANVLPTKGAGEKGGKRLILRRDLDAYLESLPEYKPRTREKSA